MTPLRIFIGYDSRESVALHVLMHSIMTRASRPVSITPLMQQPLRSSGIYTRERGATESTEFSLTRFLCPYLSGFKGYSLFLDCDMLALCDIHEIVGAAIGDNLRGSYVGSPFIPDEAAWVCKHDYIPKDPTKFLGQQQTQYPCKNWSSMVLFNNAACKKLTPEYVSKASGLELHRFQWADSWRVGSLPLEYNWLVGEYDPNPKAKILHWTLGGPWFAETANADHADLWFAEQAAMNSPAFKESMVCQSS